MKAYKQVWRWWWLIVPPLAIPLAIWGWHRTSASPDLSDPLSPEELRSVTEALKITPPATTREFRISVEVERSLLSFYAKVVFDKLDPLPNPRELVPASEKRRLGFEGPGVHPPWFGAYPAKPSDARFIKNLDNSSTMYCLLRTEEDGTVLYLEGVAGRDMFPAPLLSALLKHPVDPYATVLGPRGKIAERIWVGDRLPFKPPAPPAPAKVQRKIIAWGWQRDRKEIERYGVLGKFSSCLWQPGKEEVSSLDGTRLYSVLFMQLFVTLQPDDSSRILREYKWSEAHAPMLSLPEHPDRPKLTGRLLQSDDFCRAVAADAPFVLEAKALFSPDTRAMYIELREPDRD